MLRRHNRIRNHVINVVAIKPFIKPLIITPLSYALELVIKPVIVITLGSALNHVLKPSLGWARSHVLKPLIAIGRRRLGRLERGITRYCLEPLRREIRYVIYYKRNVEQLEAGVKRLCGTRADVQGAVAGRQDKTISVDVQKWLEDVVVTERSGNTLLSEAKSNMKLLNGWCPNPMTMYSLSKKTIKMFEHIVELQEEMIFDKIADPAPPPRIGSITLSALNPEFSRRKQHNPRNISKSQTKK